MDDPRLCCVAPPGAECVYFTPPHPLFTCRKTFLQNTTIKSFMWVLGIAALVGNAVVITNRVRSKHATTIGAVQTTLITNLAVSDFLMGVYMILLAVMDLLIGESYFWDGKAEEWRSSVTCQVAGFISVVSSETSVFLVTLISLQRFSHIMFPFTERRLGKVSSKVACCVIWFVSLFLAGFGIILNHYNPDAYSLSDVCVGLPLIRTHTQLVSQEDEASLSLYQTGTTTTVASSTSSTWLYSICLFLGVNLLCFLVIFCCYVAIFIKARISHGKAGFKIGLSREAKMALKMSLIVGTDFFCWMPIIILGILVQAGGVDVTSDIYAWLVVFVLPINSAINPFLYTIIEMLSK